MAHLNRLLHALAVVVPTSLLLLSILSPVKAQGAYDPYQLSVSVLTNGNFEFFYNVTAPSGSFVRVWLGPEGTGCTQFGNNFPLSVAYNLTSLEQSCGFLRPTDGNDLSLLVGPVSVYIHSSSREELVYAGTVNILQETTTTAQYSVSITAVGQQTLETSAILLSKLYECNQGQSASTTLSIAVQSYLCLSQEITSELRGTYEILTIDAQLSNASSHQLTDLHELSAELVPLQLVNLPSIDNMNKVVTYWVRMPSSSCVTGCTLQSVLTLSVQTASGTATRRLLAQTQTTDSSSNAQVNNPQAIAMLPVELFGDATVIEGSAGHAIGVNQLFGLVIALITLALTRATA